MKEVKCHPESDKLLITQLDVGDEQMRQIVAGLHQYVEISSFKGSKFVVIRNLKTARLAGETSEGMILAASSPDGKVFPITPPVGSKAGDMLYPENFESPEDASMCPKTLKGDIWRGIVAKLAVSDEKAAYDGVPLVTTMGPVTAPGFPDASTIS